MSLKLLCSGMAVTITLIAFIPYIRSILSNTTKPHVFSWVIWALTTLIVFFAQLEAGGGIGAWPIGISGLLTALIATLAFFKRADISITKTDWLFFSAALASVPFWYFTSDPLWAVVILSTVDLLGFGPTLRKSYAFPREENLLFFMLLMLRNILAALALEAYSVTTLLFPLSMAVACAGIVAIIVCRRRIISTLTDKI